MKRLLVALLGLSFVTTACTASGTRLAPQDPSRAPLTPAVSRAAAIYSAVIRQLVTNDASRGAGAIKRVYVIDGAVGSAEDPQQSLSRQRPPRFDPAVKDGIITALSDLPPLTFISDRSAVVAGQGPGHVIHGGVLLTLGPIRGDGGTVTVGNSYWINGLDGQWLTYVVQERATGWTIKGTAGPAAIS